MALVTSLLFALSCTFESPVGWEEVDVSLLSPRIKKAYVHKVRNHFSPSLNLAVEENVQGTLETYLASVKNLYEKDPSHRWRDLGAFQTKAGSARLTSIDMHTQHGEGRLLQLIFLKNEIAYILTASAAKEDFSSLHKIFDRAFSSLNFSDPVESP